MLLCCHRALPSRLVWLCAFTIFSSPTRLLSTLVDKDKEELGTSCLSSSYSGLLSSPRECARLRSPLLSSRGGGLNNPRRCSDPRFRSYQLLLLLPVLAREVLRPGHDDHHDRSHYKQPEIEQDGHGGLGPQVVDDES